MRVGMVPAALLFACHAEPGGAWDTGEPLIATISDGSAEMAPPTREIDLAVGPDALRLVLRRNDDLFAPGYTEYSLQPDGSRVLIPADQRADRAPCWYQGEVRDAVTDAPRGVVAVRACDDEGGLALNGALSLDGTWNHLRVDEHGVQRMYPASFGPPDASPIGPATPMVAPPRPGPPPSTYWNELAFVHDHARVQALGASNAAVDGATLANAVDLVFAGGSFVAPVRFVLTGQVLLQAGDPWTAARIGDEVSTESLLQAFTDWRGSHVASLPHHDSLQLLSGDDFEYPRSGLGWVSTTCTSFATSIAQTSTNLALDTTVSAHEIGHNLGMLHDAGAGFIMAAVGCAVCEEQPTQFSAVSLNAANTHLLASGSCLHTRPDGAGEPSCGDGLIQDGEACDCGAEDCSIYGDPCCDGATCAFTDGGTCSAWDGCCDAETCAPYTAAEEHICRSAEGPCDVADVCDGRSARCETDLTAPAGQACETESELGGVCYGPTCVSAAEHCAQLGSDVGQPMTESATCAAQRLALAPCGAQLCSALTAPNACFMFTASPPNHVLVHDGTACGDGQQCVDGACLPSAEIDLDECPFDPAKTDVGTCGCGVEEADADGDTVCDVDDGCPDHPAKAAPGTCGCGVPDVDFDFDGALDCVDGCPFDIAKVAPGVCGCGAPDDDHDGDGAFSCLESCPFDPDKLEDGVCGCGVADGDGDGDGAPDCLDACPADNAKTTLGVCGCGVADSDADGDGLADCLDLCPSDAGKSDPGACGCGAADTDGDGDLLPDCLDVCPSDPAKDAPGACGCGAVDGTCVVCGDGARAGGEACDDGNTRRGDGCSATCEVEPLFARATPRRDHLEVTIGSATPGATVLVLAGPLGRGARVPGCPGLRVPIDARAAVASGVADRRGHVAVEVRTRLPRTQRLVVLETLSCRATAALGL